MRSRAGASPAVRLPMRRTVMESVGGGECFLRVAAAGLGLTHLRERREDEVFEVVELLGGGGAEVEVGGGGGGDGVDGGAAGDGADVEGGAGIGGQCEAASSVSAAASARMGLGGPASAQEWPPGPVISTRRRREPRARSTTEDGACAFERDGGGDALRVGRVGGEEWRMPRRSPSPSSPTLAAKRMVMGGV